MPSCLARVFIRLANLFSLPDRAIAAAFAASFPEHIIMPAARSLSRTCSPSLRYMELPSAVISCVKVTTRSFFAASSNVRSVVISLVVLAGRISLSLFFERIMLPFSTQYSTIASAPVSGTSAAHTACGKQNTMAHKSSAEIHCFMRSPQ